MTSGAGRSLRHEREADWRRLDDLLDKLERRSARAMTVEELLAIPVLYRAALSSLSVARATVLDQALVDYLEGLSSRAYFVVYGTRLALADRIGRFFASDWPRAVQALRRETIIAACLLLIGTIGGFGMVRADPDWFYAFVPAGLSAGRDPMADTAVLRDALHGHASQRGLPLFAGYLFTHNAQVAIMAFSLGFAFCVPTAFLLLYSGGTLGAFLSLYASRGLAVDLGGWLMVHGVTELWAVVLAGAAGFHIGAALASPGSLTRLDAAAQAGKRAAVVLGGVLVMLLCAGLLEGIVRQVLDDTAWRYLVATGTAAFWLAYLYAPRRLDGTGA